MPPSMEAEEHLGVLTHQDEWRPGATCDDCALALQRRYQALRGVVPAANIRRLQHERESGMSSRDVEREVIESARRDGRELARPSDFATQHWKAH